jgi:hypothetical protein
LNSVTASPVTLGPWDASKAHQAFAEALSILDHDPGSPPLPSELRQAEETFNKFTKSYEQVSFHDLVDFVQDDKDDPRSVARPTSAEDDIWTTLAYLLNGQATPINALPDDIIDFQLDEKKPSRVKKEPAPDIGPDFAKLRYERANVMLSNIYRAAERLEFVEAAVAAVKKTLGRFIKRAAKSKQKLAFTVHADCDPVVNAIDLLVCGEGVIEKEVSLAA